MSPSGRWIWTGFPTGCAAGRRSHGLQLTDGALELLAERTEGNLLAAQQELERLQLLCPTDVVDETLVTEAVMDSARFNVFELMAETLQGRCQHALRILNVLQQEGENPLGLLAVIARDVRALQALHHR